MQSLISFRGRNPCPSCFSVKTDAMVHRGNGGGVLFERSVAHAAPDGALYGGDGFTRETKQDGDAKVCRRFLLGGGKAVRHS